jgi:UDP-N-acetylglucosamine acyltransferase
MGQIHPTAIVDPKVELAQDVTIGAYSVVRAGVKIGAGTTVLEHCILEGNTTIGQKCKIGPAAYVGMPPQHLKFDGKGTCVVIGDEVVIREMASVHRSIKNEPGAATRVGNRNWLMAGSHVGHDCNLGDDIILANAVLLGGHCQIGNQVFIGGGATIHQFVRIGRLAILAGNEAVTQDVPPFAAARYRGLKGYNAIGCKRAGLSREAIFAIRKAYYCFHTHRTTPNVLAAIRQSVPMPPEINELIEFMGSTHRGILGSVRFHPGDRRDDDESED